MSVFKLSAWSIPVLWAAWALYWMVSAGAVKAAERTESLGSRLAHIVPLLLSGWLLATRHMPIEALTRPVFAPAVHARYPIGAALVALGLGFASWARFHLGRNWSGSVTVKAGHELIDTGPYARVRHPIYTGLILALIGSAVALDEWRGVLAVAIAIASLWRKLNVEERFMLEAFGDRYADYRRRVPALVPRPR